LKASLPKLGRLVATKRRLLRNRSISSSKIGVIGRRSDCRPRDALAAPPAVATRFCPSSVLDGAHVAFDGGDARIGCGSERSIETSKAPPGNNPAAPRRSPASPARRGFGLPGTNSVLGK